MLARIHGGYIIAVGASIALISSALVFSIAFALSAYFILAESRSFDSITHETPLPVLFFLSALGMIAGSAAAVVAVAVYGFRARWFWWCLIVAAVSLLVAAPIGTVIAAFALVALIRFRQSFPRHAIPSTAAP